MTARGENFETDLISIVAHDLKTPVSAAKGFIELVQQSGPLNERQQQFADRALMALHRMEQLIRGLLDLGRLESGLSLDMGDCDLLKLIRDAAGLLQDTAQRRGVTFSMDFPTSEVMVRGDAHRLSQVISNLLSNAVKYNRDEGEVRVGVEIQNSTVRVDIQDTGMGIRPEEQSSVFKPYYRSNSEADRDIEGTGLGLAIAETIIRMHGEQIWLESTPEVGTTFSFTLSLSQPGETSASIEAGDGRRRFDPRRAETASEESDIVDDDSQESQERMDADPRQDEV